MTEINLNAHYTSNPKVTRPINTAISAPNHLPTKYVYNDRDAKKRLKDLNSNVNQNIKNEGKTSLKSFLKVFGAIVLTILGIKWAQKAISFFK